MKETSKKTKFVFSLPYILFSKIYQIFEEIISKTFYLHHESKNHEWQSCAHEQYSSRFERMSHELWMSKDGT